MFQDCPKKYPIFHASRNTKIHYFNRRHNRNHYIPHMQQEQANNERLPGSKDSPSIFMICYPWELFRDKYIRWDGYIIFLFYLKITSYFKKV